MHCYGFTHFHHLAFVVPVSPPRPPTSTNTWLRSQALPPFSPLITTCRSRPPLSYLDFPARRSTLAHVFNSGTCLPQSYAALYGEPASFPVPLMLCVGLPSSHSCYVSASTSSSASTATTTPPTPTPTPSSSLPTCLAVLHPHTGSLPLYDVHYLYSAQIFLTLDLIFSVPLVAADSLGTGIES